MSNLTGSCNCGSVKYQVAGDIKKIVNCHCNLCRKMNGSAFSTYAAVLTSEFKILSGKLTNHNVSENVTKSFCGQCGTPVFNTNPKYAGLNILHFGTLDSSIELVPDVNIYSDSEVSWINSIGTIPSLNQGLS